MNDDSFFLFISYTTCGKRQYLNDNSKERDREIVVLLCGSVDISWPVHEFKNMVKGTQVFDATHMGITTHMLTKDYLPDEVFAEPQDEEIEENDIVTQQQDDSDMELEEEEDEVEEQEVSSSGHKRTSQSPQEGSEPKRSKTVIRSQSIIMPQTATTST
ncbi:hypothetical protein K501DRAFT_53415 [Backusella circina FSU 941]|nr:hypothetical protein K501DRAFT_53415 [Backusella circina FSU 941]